MTFTMIKNTVEGIKSYEINVSDTELEKTFPEIITINGIKYTAENYLNR